MRVTPEQASAAISGPRLYLRSMQESDATDTYCRWLNDPAVNQYLESRFTTATLDSVRDFIRRTQLDESQVFFAILLKNEDRHIGNIKLGPIHPVHRYAEIGLLIGEKDCWGRGYAAEAIELVSRYAFDTLRLHRLSAGCYADNVGSARAFEKAGFTREGLRRSCCLNGDRYVDVILLGLVRPGEESGTAKRENTCP